MKPVNSETVCFFLYQEISFQILFIFYNSKKKLKEVGGGMPPRNKKNTWNQFLLMVSQISRLDIIFHIQLCLSMCFSCSTNLLVNIPFSLPQQSSPAVLYPSSSRVVRRRDSNDFISFLEKIFTHFL